MSQADELLKLKELLDAGILTQEEFNRKKDEIIGNSKKEEIEEEPIKTEIKNEVKSEPKERDASNDKPKKESKHIVWWIFFGLFALVAFVSLVTGDWIDFIIDTMIALLCNPKFISWLEKDKNIKLSTAIRIILIVVLIIFTPTSTETKGKVNNTQEKSTVIDVEEKTEEPVENVPNEEEQKAENIDVTPKEEAKKEKGVFVPQTDGEDFFKNVLCGVTQYGSLEPMEMPADDMIPYDIIDYMSNSPLGDYKYSFEVITNKNKEIANIQMFFYNYGKEDPTNYFMAATRLDYPTKNVAQLTDFISKNIGKDEIITIGDFTFHLFNGTSSNCVILDIYTEEWAKINGN